MFEWLYQFFASRKLTLILFLITGLFLIPKTLGETTSPSLGVLGSMLFGLVSLNLILCTVRRIRALSKTIVIVHCGVILTFLGAVISSFGFVATVNIYEGSSVNTVYRWDREKDMPLGADLRVKKIHREYYPAPLKVGVLKGEEKAGLFELRTGESFRLGTYTVTADALDIFAKNLRLSVSNKDHFVGTAETAGTRDLPSDFPYDFRLVAYKDSALKRMWVDLEVSQNSHIVAEGTSEVNSPLTWEKLTMHFTKMDADAYGNPYAGIQITYDPGVPYVYAGFTVLGVGCMMYMRRLYGRR